MTVGVTGRYCAGKTTVAELLAAHGYLHIDVDAVGHRALAELEERVVDRFGPEIRLPTGGIDRKALGRIVFADSAELRALEDIVHPRMVEIVTEESKSARDSVVNAALLFRMRLDAICDLVIWVSAPLVVRVFRAMKRDGLSLGAVRQRIRSQTDLAAQLSSSSVDIYTVRNTGNARRLESRLSRVPGVIRARNGENGRHDGKK